MNFGFITKSEDARRKNEDGRSVFWIARNSYVNIYSGQACRDLPWAPQGNWPDHRLIQ